MLWQALAARYAAHASISMHYHAESPHTSHRGVLVSACVCLCVCLCLLVSACVCL